LQDLLAGIEASAIATHLRASRWTYPLVNAAHILGVALLIGAVAPLDLRLMGLWRDRPLEIFLAVLRPVAAVGAALAMLAGALLFAVKARDYAAMPLFQAKMALIALGLANAALLGGSRLAAIAPARRRLAGALSLTIWITVLVCGRLVGYLRRPPRMPAQALGKPSISYRFANLESSQRARTRARQKKDPRALRAPFGRNCGRAEPAAAQ